MLPYFKNNVLKKVDMSPVKSESVNDLFRINKIWNSSWGRVGNQTIN